MFDNKWRGEKIAWQLHSAFPWSNLTGFSAGIAPIPIALDPIVGTEVALFIVDYTEFAHDIARLEPFQLHIKSGLVPCSAGPVVFFLFWLPDPRAPQISFATFECTVNPHDPNMMQPYWDLARQSHWHVFVIGPDDEELNWFEFENDFSLHATLEPVANVISNFPCRNFDAAKLEFQERFTVDDLLAMNGNT